jgi:hypothetical protein
MLPGEGKARDRLGKAERAFNRTIAREIKEADRGIAAVLNLPAGRANDTFRRSMVKVFNTYTERLLNLQREATHAANISTPLQATTVPFPQSLSDDLMQLIGVQRKFAQDRFNATLQKTTARDRRSSLRRDLDALFVRMATTGRTEEYAQFRQTIKRILQRNPKTIKGWVWLGVLDERTCPVCWALHGKEFRRDTVMYSHPNCRCIPLPLAYRESFSEPTGPELFDKLPADVQRAILGVGKHGLYIDGDITLDDLVASKGSGDNRIRYVRPLKRLKGNG